MKALRRHRTFRMGLGAAAVSLGVAGVLLGIQLRDTVDAVVELCEMGTKWDAPLFPPRPVAGSDTTEPWCLDIEGMRSCVRRSPAVVMENARPGTTDWCIASSAPADIEGFADRVSAQRREPVTMFVSTSASTFHIEAFRLGYYGGLGGRRVWRSGELPGIRQPKPRLEPSSKAVEARWSPSVSIRVGAGWVPGVFLFKLESSDGGQAYVPLVVRDDRSRAAIGIQIASATYQAYNRWGGYSLYYGPSRDPTSRARAVSFDRPFDRNRGSGDLLQGGDQPFVALVERLGLDVTYWSDLDLHLRPEMASNHRAVVVLGHSEYWSTAMRQAVTDARARGANLLFLQANDVFRHIRVAPASLGPNRRIVAYKDAAEDPMAGVNDAEVTVDWRDPPLNRPESSLVGAAFECNPGFADMVVSDGSAWVFAGTGLDTGDRLPTLVGYTEFDRVHPDFPTPRSIQLLAHSPVRCRGRSTYSDMTYYTARSGAGVLDTGTTAWVYRLELPCVLAGRCSPIADDIQRITQNILAAFGAGPAGTRFPSRPNSEEFGLHLTHPIDP